MSAVGKARNKVAAVWGSKVAPRSYEDVCVIKRRVAVNGTTAQSTIHSNVPCKIKPLSGGPSAEAIRAKTAYLIETPVSLSGRINTVQAEDFLVVEPSGVQPQRTFKVQSVEHDFKSKVFARCTIES